METAAKFCGGKEISQLALFGGSEQISPKRRHLRSLEAGEIVKEKESEKQKYKAGKCNGVCDYQQHDSVETD